MPPVHSDEPGFFIFRISLSLEISSSSIFRIKIITMYYSTPVEKIYSSDKYAGCLYVIKF
jgi:hypothetical protein